MVNVGKIKERDIIKTMIRLMNKYLENDNLENKEDKKYDFLNNNNEQNNNLNFTLEKENDVINITKLANYTDTSEENIKLEKDEIKEISNRNSKINLNIGRIIINQIISKQDEYSMKNVHSFYRGSYKKQLEDGKLLIDIRRELVDEFSDFIWKYHVREEILFISINFMDNIICKEVLKRNDTERIRYLGYTCLYIAIKIERVINVNCKDICRKLSINTSKILNLEKYVLDQLTFRLNPVSSLLFLQYFMGILMESYLKNIVGTEFLDKFNESINSESNYLNKNHSSKLNIYMSNLNNLDNEFKMKNSSSLIINILNKKSGKGINKVLEYYISCYLLELCLYEVEILKFSPLCQALSALLVAKECLGANNQIYVKEYLNEYLLDETIMEEYIKRNVNAIKRILNYPFIQKISTTKKYLTSEYMNAANYVLRFIHPNY